MRDTHTDDELRTGRLVRAIAATWPTRFACCVVGTADALQRSPVRRFREWLVSEAGPGRAG